MNPFFAEFIKLLLRVDLAVLGQRHLDAFDEEIEENFDKT